MVTATFAKLSFGLCWDSLLDESSQFSVSGLVLWAIVFCVGFDFAYDTNEVIFVMFHFVKQA